MRLRGSCACHKKASDGGCDIRLIAQSMKLPDFILLIYLRKLTPCLI